MDFRAIDRIQLTGARDVDAMHMIRFVQDEIRYLCESEGIYNFTPKPPRYVLRRGAGDCKGKANLLVQLLQSIGVDANPALVNSRRGKGLIHDAPSLSQFSHAIVRVIMAGEAYYFDPTAGKRAGDFEHSAQLDFGYALNLTADGEELVELPFDLSRKVFALRHCVDLRERANATVTVTRTHYAQLADKVRFHIGSTEFAEVQREYLERAEADIDASLKVIRPFTVIGDDTRRNTLITEECYAITGIEAEDEAKCLRITTNFHRSYPYPDDDRFELQTQVLGSAEHDIEVLYPANVDSRALTHCIANDYFEYRSATSADGSRLKIHNCLKPIREVVDHAGIECYREDARRLYRLRINRFEVARCDADMREKSEAWSHWKAAAWLLVAHVLVLACLCTYALIGN